MVFHKDEYELSMAYDNLNNPSESNDAQSHSDEDSKVTSAAAGETQVFWFNNNLKV